MTKPRSPEQKEAKRLYQIKWRAEHKELVAKYAVEYRDRHLEECKAQSNRWKSEHSDQVKAVYDKWLSEHGGGAGRYEDNREYFREYCVKNCERIKSRKAIYQLEHREEIKAKRHAPEYQQRQSERNVIYRAKNKEKLRICNAKWRKEHPEIVKFSVALHQYRVKNSVGADYVTIEKLNARWDYYGRKCYLCGSPASATDHVVPLDKGGTNWPANLRPICRICNSIKHAKWPYSFAAHRARVSTQIAHWCEVLDLVVDSSNYAQ
jgi:5-methylcytosine-specific restriction endonuclease McrA